MKRTTSKICSKCHRTIYIDKTKALAFVHGNCDPCYKAWWETPRGEATETTMKQSLGVQPLSRDQTRWHS